MIIRKKGFFN